MNKIANTAIASSLLALASASAVYGDQTTTSQTTGGIDDNQRIYYPQQCTHNANRVVCTFAFVNQGPLSTIVATGTGGYPELYLIKLVDDAHVAHDGDLSYFLDRYGNRQKSMTVNTKDQGAYVVEFPNVDVHVSSGQFNFKQQLIGPIAINAQPTTQVVNAPNTSQAVPTNLSLPNGVAQPATVTQQTVNGAQQPITDQQNVTNQQPAAYQRQPTVQINGFAPQPLNTVNKAADKAADIQQKTEALKTTTEAVKGVTNFAKTLGGMFGGGNSSDQSGQNNH